MIRNIKYLKLFIFKFILYLILTYSATCEDLTEYRINILEKYLSSIKNISFTFLQTTNNEEAIKGWMIIEKPNKIRIEYEEPQDLIIVANKNYIVLYDANDNLTTSLDNDGPWNILTNPNIILSNDETDKNINGFVEEIKEIDMKDGKHLFYKILMKNKQNINFPPIIIHTMSDPPKILGWTIYNKNKTYIKILEIIDVNIKNINKEIFYLSDADRKSGNVWKGLSKRAPAERKPKYR